MAEARTKTDIVEAADRLFYQQGYEHTSFADIAGAVGISRGNFYHHFKTKDEILDAVIAARIEATRSMLDLWESEADGPKARIGRFIQMLVANRSDIRRYGCPVGTLCSELAKLGHQPQAEANQLFSLFRVWLRRQFVLLGRDKDADERAMHLLARSQGVAVLASAFRDDKFIKQEVGQMIAWLDQQTPRGARPKTGKKS